MGLSEEEKSSSSSFDPKANFQEKTILNQFVFRFVIYFHISFFFFAFFQGCTHGIWRFWGWGSNRSCRCRPTPQPQRRGTWDPSRVCNLHHSSQQPQILNPLSEARDWTWNLMVPSRICFHWTTVRTPNPAILLNLNCSLWVMLIFYKGTR